MPVFVWKVSMFQLKDASPSYKTRHDVKPEPKQEPQEKTKRKYNKKVVEKITLNL